MSDYMFKGEPISGPAAYVLLGSIRRVMTECPNPTLEDVMALDTIVKDFEKKLEESLEKAYQEDDFDDINNID